ncbi:protein-export membrane protein SecD [Candidatus Endolissoclinum faulkneri L2]|uniref:Protein translocase subunit SecD n=1 Tax=Candidatus Endolissoclinum faulkneri L2 TaxID=1193729 RepID=K7YF97_9PROT|nr:protein translocase subunit SecD [Candidatus Endolissoclinum faulkneri]AFX98255.1 protein-export membrane protein SecD [Candidatus Endolissoclinum faulkneri L2]
MMQFKTWNAIINIFVCLIGIVYAIPNVLDKTIADEWPIGFPGKQISLGLDLRGGAHLLLEVDANVLIQERLESVLGSVRKALREAKVGYVGLGIRGDVVSFTLLSQIDKTIVEKIVSSFGSELVIDRNSNIILLSIQEKAIRQIKTNATQNAIEILRRRIDETGTREPLIQRQGVNRILIQVPGINDPQRIKNLIGKTAKLTFHLVTNAPEINQQFSNVLTLPMLEGGSISIDRRSLVSGENLLDARTSFDENHQSAVTIRFDTLGSYNFARATTENVGKSFAIVLDRKVISAPVIREPILGGSAQISGRFTVQEANDLALLLRSGALPAPLKVLEERSIGPGLGKDSVNAGCMAAVISLILIISFMIAFYGLFGLFANAALFVNIILILGALSALQATLTLPGIVGIVLTIGMAVDANVLIFERMRDEYKAGRQLLQALDAGYRRALKTIVDSNVTTLLAALFLFVLGSGTIRGFAVTLTIGIVTSMFTAIMITRMFVVCWLRYYKPTRLPI